MLNLFQHLKIFLFVLYHSVRTQLFFWICSTLYYAYVTACAIIDCFVPFTSFQSQRLRTSPITPRIKRQRSYQQRKLLGCSLVTAFHIFVQWLLPQQKSFQPQLAIRSTFTLMCVCLSVKGCWICSMLE